MRKVIRCLHGWRQNGPYVEKAFSAAFSAKFDVVECISAPLQPPAPPPGNFVAILPKFEDQRVWWNTTSARAYVGIWDSFSYLESRVGPPGEPWVLCGFSQGACFSVLYLLRELERNSPALKDIEGLVCIGFFLPRDQDLVERLRNLAEAIKAGRRPKCSVPARFLFGKGDEVTPFHEDIPKFLENYFETFTIEFFDGIHKIPSKI